MNDETNAAGALKSKDFPLMFLTFWWGLGNASIHCVEGSFAPLCRTVITSHTFSEAAQERKADGGEADGANAQQW